MMSRERASIFSGEDEPDFDISGFVPAGPKPAPERHEVAAVSDAAGFRSRGPVQPKRISRTGRSVQFNLKATPETIDLFRAISDRQGWSLAITLERALAALERELTERG
jgi:hypothetical protein